MSTVPEHQTEPRVRVTLRASERWTEVRIRVSWHGRLSGPAAVRLLIAAALVLAATAIAKSAHDELTRVVLYLLAGFATAARPRIRP